MEQNKFCQFLTNIRDAQPTVDDWKLLMSQTTCNISIVINENFEKNVHLFSKNDNFCKHNRTKLHSLWELVTHHITTKLSNYGSRDDNCADELDIELLISKRSRVMLMIIYSSLQYLNYMYSYIDML